MVQKATLLAMLGVLVVALAATTCRAVPPRDPLAAEIERWTAFLDSNRSTAEAWIDVKKVSQPVLASAAQALRDGRRLLALQRLAAVRMYLAAGAYVFGLSPAQRKDTKFFAAEWARLGTVLRADLGKPRAAALDGIQPAAVRAIGEAVEPQIHVYYETSLEYGRDTEPQNGLFYLGVAQAQRDLAALCRELSAPAALRPPPLHPLGGELDRLEGEMLEAYRPPAAIDRHDDFILASSLLKEARELDEAGLRYGALLRYLQVAQRVAQLRPGLPPLTGDALAGRLREAEARLPAGELDHSIGRLFLESAQADVAVATAEKPPAAAAAIAGDVLPRYFAALGPARPEPPRPAPEVTVTLVRGPYT